MTDAAETIGVLVAEDNRDLRDAVCALIAGEPGLRVTGAVARVADLPGAMRADAARVLVLDLDLRGESALPALQHLRAEHPSLGVVIHSGHDRATVAHLLQQASPCEYVTKTGEVTPLLNAIRRAARSGADGAD